MPKSVTDPRPLPPLRPSSDDCCRSGCDPCVFDLYQDALARYRTELEAWERRQAAAKKKAGASRLP